MRITARQLRQIIKEELSRAMNEEDTAPGAPSIAQRLAQNRVAPTVNVATFDYEPESRDTGYVPKMTKGVGALTADPEGFIERITSRPLVLGSQGEDVRTAQFYLIEVLREIGRKTPSFIGSITSQLQKILKQPATTGNRELVNMLADKIEESGPDGKFGPMTKLATEVFQHVAQSGAGPDQPQLATDGKIGRETGITMINGLKRGEFSPIQTPELPSIKYGERLSESRRFNSRRLV